MLVLALAAVLFTPPVQSGDLTRSLLTDVCLPYVAGESDGSGALDFLGFLAAPPSNDGRMYATEDQGYLLNLTTTGSAEDDNLNRACVIQARRESLSGAQASVEPVLREQGFTVDAEMPAERPVWTKGAVTVSMRKVDGRATVVRVSYSSLDAG